MLGLKDFEDLDFDVVADVARNESVSAPNTVRSTGGSPVRRERVRREKREKESKKTYFVLKTHTLFICEAHTRETKGGYREEEEQG